MTLDKPQALQSEVQPTSSALDSYRMGNPQTRNDFMTSNKSAETTAGLPNLSLDHHDGHQGHQQLAQADFDAQQPGDGRPGGNGKPWPRPVERPFPQPIPRPKPIPPLRI